MPLNRPLTINRRRESTSTVAVLPLKIKYTMWISVYQQNTLQAVLRPANLHIRGDVSI